MALSPSPLPSLDTPALPSAFGPYITAVGGSRVDLSAILPTDSEILSLIATPLAVIDSQTADQIDNAVLSGEIRRGSIQELGLRARLSGEAVLQRAKLISDTRSALAQNAIALWSAGLSAHMNAASMTIQQNQAKIALADLGWREEVDTESARLRELQIVNENTRGLAQIASTESMSTAEIEARERIALADRTSNELLAGNEITSRQLLAANEIISREAINISQINAEASLQSERIAHDDANQTQQRRLHAWEVYQRLILEGASHELDAKLRYEAMLLEQYTIDTDALVNTTRIQAATGTAIGSSFAGPLSGSLSAASDLLPNPVEFT
jgi:hypothetical protein